MKHSVYTLLKISEYKANEINRNNLRPMSYQFSLIHFVRFVRIFTDRSQESQIDLTRTRKHKKT